MEDMIRRIIELKKGDKEFILSGQGDYWQAGIGNPNACVALGETEPEISGEATTAFEAVASLLTTMERL